MVNGISKNPIIEALANTTVSKEHTDPQYVKQIMGLQNHQQPISSTMVEEPLLEMFVENDLIPSDFKLNPIQESTIRKLFEKWALHSNICLIDLLGVQIYDAIDVFKSHLEDHRQLKDKFCEAILHLYLFLDRIYGPQNPLEPEGEKYYTSIEDITTRFNKVHSALKEAYRTKINSPNPLLTRTLEKELKEKIEKLHHESSNAINLLIFLAKSSDVGFELLINKSLNYFNGSKDLKKNHHTTFSHLKKYKTYMDNLFSIAADGISITAGVNFNFLNLAIDKPNPHLIDVLKKQIRQVENYKPAWSRAYNRAYYGQLTPHEFFKTDTKTPSKVNQKELTELLLRNLSILHIYRCVLKDYLAILDECILPGFYSTWIMQDNIVSRFWVNLSMFKELVPEPVERGPVRELIRTKMMDKFDTIICELKRVSKFEYEADLMLSRETPQQMLKNKDSSNSAVEYKKVLPDEVNRLNHRKSKNKTIENQQSNSEDHKDQKSKEIINVISICDLPFPDADQMSILIQSFEKKLAELPELLIELKTELKKILLQLPKEKQTLTYFKECCFQECIKYCRLSLIFNDYRAIHDNIDFLHKFPETLAAFIELEGIDESFFKDVSLVMRPQVQQEEEAGSSSTSQPTRLKDQVQKLSIKKKSNSHLAEETLKKQAAPETDKNEFELFKLDHKSSKDRSVINVLKQLAQIGFFTDRQTGSHLQLKHQETGHTLTVPNNKEIPIGTVGAIQRQARNALKEMTKQ